MKKVAIGVLAVLCLVVVYVYAAGAKEGTSPVPTVSKGVPSSGLVQKQVILNGVEYTLDVADTAELWETGLSYRQSLAPQTGMLFVFDTPDVYQFWMKDMNFPIDMIWFDADKRVVFIEANVDPATYPQSFGPETLTQYVIEIPAGDTTKVGLEVGDVVSF